MAQGIDKRGRSQPYSPIKLLTCLAEGADQLCAEAALNAEHSHEELSENSNWYAYEKDNEIDLTI